LYANVEVFFAGNSFFCLGGFLGIKFPEGCGVEVEEGCFLLSIFLETNLVCVCVSSFCGVGC
jgi:hypothetical protein